MPYEKLNIIIEEMKKIHKLHAKLIQDYCSDMTPEQGKLLYLIQKHQMSQNEIAEHFHITKATLSVRIRRLVDSGLIEKKMDKKDKRSYTITLSDKGLALMTSIEKQIDYVQEVICKDITDEDYDAVLKVIYKIQKNMKEEIE